MCFQCVFNVSAQWIQRPLLDGISCRALGYPNRMQGLSPQLVSTGQVFETSKSGARFTVFDSTFFWRWLRCQSFCSKLDRSDTCSLIIAWIYTTDQSGAWRFNALCKMIKNWEINASTGEGETNAKTAPPSSTKSNKVPKVSLRAKVHTTRGLYNETKRDFPCQNSLNSIWLQPNFKAKNKAFLPEFIQYFFFWCTHSGGYLHNILVLSCTEGAGQ